MKGIVAMNNQIKLISVIVPVYNVSLYLDKCIDSLSNQNYGYYDISSDIEKYDLFFKNHSFGSVCFSLFKKEAIDDIRFINDFKYGEDYLFYFNVINNCNKIYFSEAILYNYIVNSFSATRKKFFDKEVKEISDHLKVDKIVFDYVFDKGLVQYKEVLLDCTMNAVINWQKNIAKNYTYAEYNKLLTNMVYLNEWNSFY